MSEVIGRLKTALTDRYAVDREIGRGGMATVFLAEDLKHHRKVAIKVLHPELAVAVGTDRFLREIEIAARLEHPHILTLIDSGEAGGLPYFVMPFVEGESLGERLARKGQLPLDEALRIAGEVADGLDYAHEQGVVHRDIKPGNILLSRGHALIADFGVAKAIGAASGGDATATATGLSVGTPRYMSPEQAAGAVEVDGRSDVYALGCVLWEMLAGEPPFDGPTPHAILARKVSEEPPEIRVIRRTVPASLENVLAKAIATSPADRFQTAGELASALQAPETVGRVRRRGRRTRQLAIATVALLTVGAGIWALATGGFSGSEPDGSTAIQLDSTAIAVLPFQVIGADSASPAWELAQSIGDLFDLKVTGDFGRRIAHPGSVVGEWRRAGGSQDSALSEAAELELGRDLGVGALVRGTLVEGDGEVVLAARMLDVATGAIRVPTVRREGPVEELPDLLDQLIVLLLARDWGYSVSSAPRLAQYEPEAVQAYLAGLRAPFNTPEEKSYFHAALEADSGLVDAALMMYSSGENPRFLPELQYAWEHQDQLSERGRAYVQVLAAGRYDGSITTVAQKIARYEALAHRWPEWGIPWNELGSRLTSHGALASVPDWPRRAREALEHNDRSWYALRFLIELAFIEEDTARARDLADRFARYSGSDTWTRLFAPSYQWRLAILQGDTAAATRALAGAPDSVLGFIPVFALLDGRGIAEADRVVASGATALYESFSPPNWAWARGREQEWRDAWRRSAPIGAGVDRSSGQIFRALLLGSSEDTSATEAIRMLERVASGGDSPPPSPDDQTLARCWITLWRLEHGDTTGARETLRHLAEVERPYRFSGWAGLIDALLTRLEGGDVRESLLRADSVVRDLPLGGGGNSAEVENLMLARLLREYGEPERALAASRRRIYAVQFAMRYTSIPEYLREEARLAATVGDTAGAIEAYRHYFALRDSRPDHPTWAASWDSMRVEYGELTGVDVP